LFVVQTNRDVDLVLSAPLFDKHYTCGDHGWDDCLVQRKQQLHSSTTGMPIAFAVVDNFWDWLLGTYRSIDAHWET